MTKSKRMVDDGLKPLRIGLYLGTGEVEPGYMVKFAWDFGGEGQ